MYYNPENSHLIIISLVSYFFFFPNLIVERFNLENEKEYKKYKIITKILSLLLTFLLIWRFSEKEFNWNLLFYIFPGVAHKIALFFYNGLTNQKDEDIF